VAECCKHGVMCLIFCNILIIILYIIYLFYNRIIIISVINAEMNEDDVNLENLKNATIYKFVF